MNSAALDIIGQLVAALTQANIAIPIVMTTVMIVKDIWNKAHPNDPPLTDAQVIDVMEAKFAEVGANADTEIARLREEIANSGS